MARAQQPRDVRGDARRFAGLVARTRRSTADALTSSSFWTAVYGAYTSSSAGPACRPEPGALRDHADHRELRLPDADRSGPSDLRPLAEQLLWPPTASARRPARSVGDVARRKESAGAHRDPAHRRQHWRRCPGAGRTPTCVAVPHDGALAHAWRHGRHAGDVACRSRRRPRPRAVSTRRGRQRAATPPFRPIRRSPWPCGARRCDELTDAPPASSPRIDDVAGARDRGCRASSCRRVTVTRFAPAARTCCSIDRCAPVPIATITITTATPIVMPSSVSADRSRCRPIARMASCTVAISSISSEPDYPTWLDCPTWPNCPPHSNRSASIGSSREACRAG